MQKAIAGVERNQARCLVCAGEVRKAFHINQGKCAIRALTFIKRRDRVLEECSKDDG